MSELNRLQNQLFLLPDVRRSATGRCSRKTFFTFFLRSATGRCSPTGRCQELWARRFQRVTGTTPTANLELGLKGFVEDRFPAFLCPLWFLLVQTFQKRCGFGFVFWTSPRSPSTYICTFCFFRDFLPFFIFITRQKSQRIGMGNSQCTSELERQKLQQR